jgi:hypothetical protein
VEQELRYRSWRGLGRTLRRPCESITKQALSWDPQGERKADPEIPEILGDESEIRRTWKDLEKTALDRRAWKYVIVDLCLQGAKR